VVSRENQLKDKERTYFGIPKSKRTLNVVARSTCCTTSWNRYGLAWTTSAIEIEALREGEAMSSACEKKSFSREMRIFERKTYRRSFAFSGSAVIAALDRN